MKNRIFSLLLILCLLLTLFPSAAFATEITAEGTCGDNLTWVLTDDGTLTISGNGPMPDFTRVNNVPWYPYASEITALVVEEGVTTIGEFAFYQYSNLSSLSLPSTLVSIGRYAFSYCSITELDLPDGLLSLGGFDGNPITELVIPDSVTKIDYLAFYECTELTSVVLPANLEHFGSWAFAYCFKLSQVVMPEMPNFQSFSGSGGRIFCANAITDLSWYTLSKIDYMMFNTSSFVELVIPDCVTYVEGFAFEGCDSMTKVTVPASVTYIGPVAFGGCDALESVYFLGDPPELGAELFQNLTAVTCYYPANNENWTAEDLKTYNGIATWVPHYPLSITTQPESVTVAEGENAIVTVEAQGDGLTYEWYYSDNGGAKFHKTSAFTGNTYKVPMTDARNGRLLYCVITDANGNSVATDVVTIRMDTAVILTQPQSVTVAEGENAIVTVEASGAGLTYEWYYSDNGGAKFYKTSAFTGNTYKVPMTDARDGRMLYCVITDRYGNSVVTDVVTICMEHHAQIVTQPQSVTVAEGKYAIVTVEAEGDGLTYEWYFSDNGGSKFYKTSAYTTATYKIPMNEARDGRMLYCVITDQYGNNVTTDVVTICMEHYAQIITQPQSVTVASGEYAVVTVEAEGDGLSYEWYYSDNGVKYCKTSAFTGNTYKVPMTDARNGRMLYCVITDRYGNSVKTATVTISMR